MFGGHIEDQETEEDTLTRELRAELGISLSKSRKLAHLMFEQGGESFDLAIYVVTEWIGGGPVMLRNEHTEIRWFPLKDAVNLTNLALPQIRALLKVLT